MTADWPAFDEGILSAVGNTPIVRLTKVFPDLPFTLHAKCEGVNPGGSAKDRAALAMLKQGVEAGLVRPGTLVVESSSGNMGIGLAQACAQLGLRFVCVVDSLTPLMTMRQLQAFGAAVEQVSLPPHGRGSLLEARLNRVQALLREHTGAFWPNQYSNPRNAAAHHRTMAEIVSVLGTVDVLVCATSTCGTLRGCAEHIRNQRLATRVIAVDAVGSVLHADVPKPRLLPGHGISIRPALFDPGLADEWIAVTDRECVAGCLALARREGILAGASSGGIIAAVARVRTRIPSGAVCAVILCDRGERYLDTVYNDNWVAERLGPMGGEELL